jgi:transcriptional regulator with XRE-family HTH domain
VDPITNHRTTVGPKIRFYRKKANLTQEELAENAELHPHYVGEVERGKYSISLDPLARIANALKVRVRDLVADI